MSSEKKKMKLARNKKLDCVFYQDCNLVVRSEKDKVVIGRIADGEIIDLDQEAIDLCEQYGLEYDKTLVEEAEDEEDKTEVKEAEEEEEAEEEPEKPTPKKPTPTPKKEKEIVESTTSSDFSKLLSSLQQAYDKGLKKEKERADKLEETNASLEETLSGLRKELEETKKKMKGILAAMQADL